MRITKGIFFLVLIFLISFSASAFAVSEEEKSFLSMYFTDEELVVVSATRSLKSITRVAENIEVVTASDIELMNAHTVAEALYNVTGLEMSNFKGPGSLGQAGIQGADYVRVIVLLDGVSLLNGNDAVPLGILPVQMIKKIEIIKGPASSTWGSSFGGVINIITKSAQEGTPTGGTIYASGGKRNTSDLRAEVFGKKGNIGIYLFSGTMNSDGLRNGHKFWHNNVFSKISVDTGERSKLDFAFFYHKSDSVQFDFYNYQLNTYYAFKEEYIHGKASFQTSLHRNVDLNLSVWKLRINENIYDVTDEIKVDLSSAHTDKYGFSGNLTIRSGIHTIVAGTDIMHAKIDLHDPSLNIPKSKKYSIFINDTVSLDKLTITPGLRYDNTNLGGEIFSPSLGMTYLVSKDILLKALIARGFYDPSHSRFFDFPSDGTGYIANPNLRQEKIWSYQLGTEANIAGFSKLKLNIFLHDINDVILDIGNSSENAGKKKIYGGEAEIETKAYKGFTLKGGFHYENIKLLNYSSASEFDTANRYGINTSLVYNDGKGLRAIIKGHYMRWHLPYDYWFAEYNGFIVDFNVMKELIKKRDISLNLFFTGHNVLNGKSYDNDYVMNPSRWIEAGLRYSF